MNSLILIAVFAAGWWTGDKSTEVQCKDDALIVASCPELVPPQDDSFGATTSTLIETVGQYRACRAACVIQEAVTDK